MFKITKTSVKREMIRPQNIRGDKASKFTRSPHISRGAKAIHCLCKRYCFAKHLILYNNRQEYNTIGRPEI